MVSEKSSEIKMTGEKVKFIRRTKEERKKERNIIGDSGEMSLWLPKQE